MELIKLHTGFSCSSSVDDNHNDDGHRIKLKRYITHTHKKTTEKIRAEKNKNLQKKFVDERENKNYQTNNSPNSVCPSLCVCTIIYLRRPIIIFNIVCNTNEIKKNKRSTQKNNSNKVSTINFTSLLVNTNKHNNCLERI